jgi:hypothetical protein
MSKKISKQDLSEMKKGDGKVKTTADESNVFSEDVLASQEAEGVEGGLCNVTCLACTYSGTFSF